MQLYFIPPIIINSALIPLYVIIGITKPLPKIIFYTHDSSF